jgi:hypothetical protein
MIFDEHNLPADFDDLSKHAPLLERTRFKGEGFIVPENYFDDLAERIITIASLSNTTDRRQPTADSFFTPGGYFEKLTDEILAVAKLSDLKTGESFEIPNSYFNELDETIHTKLALDNLKQDEGFDVPENYFENFSDKILSHVAMDEMSKGPDADVPPGYFDTLADRVAARIAEEEGETEKTAERGRVIVFAEVLKRYARPLSAAASVALIVSVAIWFFNREKKEVLIADTKPVKQNIQPVIPAPKRDTVNMIIQPQNEIVAEPKKINKRKPPVNQEEQPVVNEIDRKDVLEQLYLLDESMVADYITDQHAQLNSTPQEESLNNEMLNYLLDHNADPSDINK